MLYSFFLTDREFVPYRFSLPDPPFYLLSDKDTYRWTASYHVFLYNRVNFLRSDLLSVIFFSHIYDFKELFLLRETNVLCFVLMTCFSYRVAAKFDIVICKYICVVFILETHLTNLPN